MRTVHAGKGQATRRLSVAAVVAVATLSLASCATANSPEAGSAEGGQAASVPSPTSHSAAETENDGDSAVWERSGQSLSSTIADTRGGSSLVGGMHLAVDRLPRFSDVAVSGRVTHIAAQLNTPSGGWNPPANATDEKLHNLSSELMPYTYVTVAVDEVMGARPNTDVAVRPGDTIQVVILGGAVEVTYSQEEARAIGYKMGCEATSVRPNASDCESTAPQGAITGTLSLTPAAEINLGDDVVGFLKQGSVPFYSGEVKDDVLISVIPEGLGLYRSTDGMWVNATSDDRVSERRLRAAARSLRNRTGGSDSFQIQ